MAFTEYWRTDFDTDEKCNKFFYGPSLNAVPDVRREEINGTSGIAIRIGSEVPDVSYFSDASGDAYTKMLADAGNRTNGDVAYCYSLDSDQHGRYELAGGAWGARTGPVTPKLADDENHRRVAQIRLMLCSWSAHGDPYAPNDGPGGAFVDKLGYPDFSELNPLAGLPATDDISGWIMRWEMRGYQMGMGRHTKIVQHFQTQVPSFPNVATTHPGGVVAPFHNAINAAPGACISDALGFGDGGPFSPNTVEYQEDSGPKVVDIPLQPLKSHWIALGGNADKTGKPPYAQALRYIVADPAEWLPNWTANAYVVEAKFNTDPLADLPVIPDSESVRGLLHVTGLAFGRDE